MECKLCKVYQDNSFTQLRPWFSHFFNGCSETLLSWLGQLFPASIFPVGLLEMNQDALMDQEALRSCLSSLDDSRWFSQQKGDPISVSNSLPNRQLNYLTKPNNSGNQQQLKSQNTEFFLEKKKKLNNLVSASSSCFPYLKACNILPLFKTDL